MSSCSNLLFQRGDILVYCTENLSKLVFQNVIFFLIPTAVHVNSSKGPPSHPHLSSVVVLSELSPSRTMRTANIGKHSLKKEKRTGCMFRVVCACGGKRWRVPLPYTPPFSCRYELKGDRSGGKQNDFVGVAIKKLV